MGAISYITGIAFGFMFVGNTLATKGLLFPRESETREVRQLDGIWNFVKSNRTNATEGIREKWYLNPLDRARPTILMPVPSSYNDLTEDQSLRDHIGTVWYDRKFFVPQAWKQSLVWIRFGSVHYAAQVWINGELVVKHEIGHLPFEADISKVLIYGRENLITVLCDNTLLPDGVPQGRVDPIYTDHGTDIAMSYTFDFFNYAGIHRSVMLYTTPQIHISEVKCVTDVIDGRAGRIDYEIGVKSFNETNDDVLVYIQIKDRNDTVVGNQSIGSELKGSIIIDDVKLWWPYLMHPEPGYLYTMEIFLSTTSQQDIDIYRMKIGIRTLAWTNTQFLINGKPIYFRGFGKHEDSDIRGKGLDYPLLIKDFNLLKWVGANAYRTSHYPYSEESMDLADEHGIMIIDECPSVDTDNFTPGLLVKHKSSIEQLIHRDRNHPSVVAWSVANEPRTKNINSSAYFGAIVNLTKSLDTTRPVTAAIAVGDAEDHAGQYMDILSFNRYNAWYHNTGRLDTITNNVINEATQWHNRHNKPVLMSEYGADTVEGLHILPAYVWSEEYQQQLFSKHFNAFDKLRAKGFFIGEFIWNFADFKTEQTYTRVGGNKKGIFTRQRQPKAVAHMVRQRYYSLAQELDHCSNLPTDLFLYISS